MNPLMTVAGWTLVHFVWQGALVAGAAAGALWLLRAAPPQLRYLVSCAALAAMLAAPLVTARTLSSGPLPAAPQTVPRPASAAVDTSAAPASAEASIPLREATGGVWPSTRFTIESALPPVVLLWLAGVAILSVRLSGGLWRVRRAHRAACQAPPSRWHPVAQRIAERLRLSRAVHVVDCLQADTPTLIGWLRPVMLLPVAALANLTPAQLDAVLAHELAHVRRHDIIVNALQSVAEVLLFYHPAVWWVSGRIRAEREHCCDTVAVEVCGDAVAYAMALTELAGWSVGRTPLALAATGGSLVERVRRVLGVQKRQTVSSVVTAMLVVGLLAGVVAVGAPVRSVLRAAQPFEVSDASRGFGPREVNERLGFELFPGPRDPHGDPRDAVAWRLDLHTPSGSMPLLGFTGRSLIRYAYDLPDARIVGGPSWIDTESVALSATLTSSSGADGWPFLIRRLLEDRLELVMHAETRNLPVYALVMADVNRRPGPGLRPSTSECLDPQTWAATPPRVVAPRFTDPATAGRGFRQRFCGADHTLTGIRFEGVTLPQMAEALSRPGPLVGEVVDRTGLGGVFDLDLDLGLLPASAVMGRHPEFAGFLAPLGFRSIYTALEDQAGLRLEKSTAPVEVLVIDYLERPRGGD